MRGRAQGKIGLAEQQVRRAGLPVDAHGVLAVLHGLLGLVALQALRAGFQIGQRLGAGLGPEKQQGQPGHHTLIMPVSGLAKSSRIALDGQ